MTRHTHGVLILIEHIWNNEVISIESGVEGVSLSARDGNGVDKLEFCIGILIESLGQVALSSGQVIQNRLVFLVSLFLMVFDHRMAQWITMVMRKHIIFHEGTNGNGSNRALSQGG